MYIVEWVEFSVFSLVCQPILHVVALLKRKVRCVPGICMYICIYVCVYVCVYIYICRYAYMYVYVYTCMYMYIYVSIKRPICI